MTTLLHISLKFSVHNSFHYACHKKPIHSCSLFQVKVASFPLRNCKLTAHRERRSFFKEGRGKSGNLVKEEGSQRKRRLVVVRFNQGFGFNGGGGGGGRDNSSTARLLGNLALAIGLTYLSMTGQLGWVLDAIVSIWLLAVLIPIVGLGTFLWWAGRDIVQSSCPNCGNGFQIFKSFVNDEPQLCPFCSQPFTVVDDKFVSESVKFSNQSSTFGQAFSDFASGSKKGKDSKAVVDVEAEIKDAE